MKGSVLDKIKADFNTDRRDRCAQLQWSGTLGDPTIWADVVSKMKEGVIAYIDSYVSTREDELRKLDNQRQFLDWDFVAFFKCKVSIASLKICTTQLRPGLVKDNLASSFASLGLLEDAQVQIDELEATYFQIITGITTYDRSMSIIAAHRSYFFLYKNKGAVPSKFTVARCLEMTHLLCSHLNKNLIVMKWSHFLIFVNTY